MKESLKIEISGTEYNLPNITQVTVLSGYDPQMRIIANVIYNLRKAVFAFQLYDIVNIDKNVYKEIMEDYFKEILSVYYASLKIEYNIGGNHIIAHIEKDSDGVRVGFLDYVIEDLSMLFVSESFNFDYEIGAWLNSTRKNIYEEKNDIEWSVKNCYWTDKVVAADFKEWFFNGLYNHIEGFLSEDRQISAMNQILSGWFESTIDEYDLQPRLIFTTQSRAIKEHLDFYIQYNVIDKDEISLYEISQTRS